MLSYFSNKDLNFTFIEFLLTFTSIIPININLAHDVFCLIQQCKLHFMFFKQEAVHLFKSNKLAALRDLNYAVIERNALILKDNLEFVDMLILRNKDGEDDNDEENGEIVERSYRTQTNETVVVQENIDRPSEIFIEDESLHLGEKPSSERSKFISSISERFQEQDLLLTTQTRW